MTKVAYDCTARQEVNKPGKWPAAPTIARKAHFCRSDKHCDGSEKCYVTKVGRECEKPLQKRTFPLTHQIHSCRRSISAAQNVNPGHELTKPGKCPPEPTIARKVHFCRSDKDGDGSEKWYVTKVGRESERPLQKRHEVNKPGKCLAGPTVDRKVHFCRSDNDCDGSGKCYVTKVGRESEKPVQKRHEVSKPGKCPAEPTKAGKALFCRSDKDRDGSKMCCVTKTGKECVKPVQKRMSPLTHQVHSCGRSISAAQNANPGPAGAALFRQTGYDCQASRKCCMTKVAYDCTGRMEESEQTGQMPSGTNDRQKSALLQKR
ncbi:hypothetical protein M513_11866 [Trichuris suis]|uniref:WAP domain-containing protein n=1 Tax=Trichuris suis TaxID=68888 RepID=A0A085LQM0_9BILA|nr:hypothetical protein M513_11866 [Trichuris suis]